MHGDVVSTGEPTIFATKTARSRGLAERWRSFCVKLSSLYYGIWGILCLVDGYMTIALQCVSISGKDYIRKADWWRQGRKWDWQYEIRHSERESKTIIQFWRQVSYTIILKADSVIFTNTLTRFFFSAFRAHRFWTYFGTKTDCGFECLSVWQLSFCSRCVCIYIYLECITEYCIWLHKAASFYSSNVLSLVFQRRITRAAQWIYM